MSRRLGRVRAGKLGCSWGPGDLGAGSEQEKKEGLLENGSWLAEGSLGFPH